LADDKPSNQLDTLTKANQALQAEIARRQLAEEETRLLLEITQAIGAAGDFPLALEIALRKVCEFTDWELGVARLLTDDRKKLVVQASWHRDSQNVTEFVTSCRNYLFTMGEGIPGRVWASRQPIWIPNLASQSTDLYPLAVLAMKVGFSAVAAVPVLEKNEIIAVLVFSTFAVREKDDRQIAIITAVAAQLGFALQRKRAEEELKKNEALLRQAREELEIRVQERTLEVARGEENLKRSASWLRSLIAATQDAVVSIDRRGCIMLFNPAAERIFGYAAAEIIGRKVNELMAEPYASEHDGYIARYERTGEAHAIGRIRTVVAKRKNGKLFPIELSVTEIEVDQEVHYAAFIRDISEKARLQDQLVERERLATIGTTAAKIGHELANPLNGMSLTIQLLEQRLNRQANPPDSQVAATVKRLKDEISRLNQLARQFLTISRREKYDFQPTELSNLINDVVNIQSPHFAQLNIQIEQLAHTNLPTIAVDPKKIKQALLNLLKNAAEAMPGGGKINIEARATGNGILIEITDTGTGIPLDIDAFEPFVTTKKEGTGIGLVIVRQIITAHGGNISYRSRPGEGTTFRVELTQK
jgi:two-component system, LuxR family, sensor kinase FixL